MAHCFLTALCQMIFTFIVEIISVLECVVASFTELFGVTPFAERVVKEGNKMTLIIVSSDPVQSLAFR